MIAQNSIFIGGGAYRPTLICFIFKWKKTKKNQACIDFMWDEFSLIQHCSNQQWCTKWCCRLILVFYVQVTFLTKLIVCAESAKKTLGFCEKLCRQALRKSRDTVTDNKLTMHLAFCQAPDLVIHLK